MVNANDGGQQWWKDKVNVYIYIYTHTQNMGEVSWFAPTKDFGNSLWQFVRMGITKMAVDQIKNKKTKLPKTKQNKMYEWRINPDPNQWGTILQRKMK